MYHVQIILLQTANAGLVASKDFPFGTWSEISQWLQMEGYLAEHYKIEITWTEEEGD